MGLAGGSGPDQHDGAAASGDPVPGPTMKEDLFPCPAESEPSSSPRN